MIRRASATALASDWRLTQRLLLTLAIWLCLGLLAPAAAWAGQPDPNRPGHRFLDNLDQRFVDRAYLGLTCAVCHTPLAPYADGGLTTW